jgi:organic radical activating enzyme
MHEACVFDTFVRVCIFVWLWCDTTHTHDMHAHSKNRFGKPEQQAQALQLVACRSYHQSVASPDSVFGTKLTLSFRLAKMKS